MKLSSEGALELKQSEGLRLDAYQDEGGVWTIGYGDTFEVKPGDRITPAEADERFLDRVAVFEAAVENLVTRPLTQGMFDVLVSFVYNNGVKAFETSALLRALNTGDVEGAAIQLGRFIHVRSKKEIELRKGDEGDTVSAWQRELVAAGYGVKVDGDFGPATEQATRRYQLDRKQTADGVARFRPKLVSANLVARRVREIVRFLRS